MILRDNNIYFRCLEKEDASKISDYSKSSNAYQFTTPFWRPWDNQEFEKFVTQGKTSPFNRIRLAICLSIDDVLIGVIELHKLNWIHGNAEVGIVIWPQEFRNKGHGTAALKLLCNWAFNTLRLRRLYAKVFDLNVIAIACFEKAGFKQEGIWRNHFFINGDHKNAILFGILQEEFAPLK